MSSFSLSPHFNKNKVFILRKSELDKRLDPFYYVPELVELERTVLSKTPKKLRDYVVSLSSGATPKTTESERYYTDAKNGIPFLRVQNLSPTGVLEFDDCKFINKETHNGLLKRNQVFEDDLLIKITGVGRMAVSSVAPEGFEGNINQHIVVIRTKDKTTSETIAAFLNADIGEKLATRRSTGGTRPALDYPALLSIPIIYDPKILAITQKVVEQKRKNEAQAKKLLASIDDYLLKELGITLPPSQENSLKNRMFTASIKSISGNRFDPFYHQKYFVDVDNAIRKSKYKTGILKHQLSFIESGSRPQGGVSNIEEGILSFGGEHVNNLCEVEVKTPKYISTEFHKLNIATETKLSDILIVKDGATTGKVGIINNPDYSGQNINEHVFLLRPINTVNAVYLVNYLNFSPIQTLIKQIITGATVTGITKGALKTLPVVLPPLVKQKEIAEHVTAIRQQAQQLKDKTKSALEQASKEIKEILLGS